jgi:enoyl-CoA hydratase/carnithine racemase
VADTGPIRIERQGSVAEIILAKPENHNALNPFMRMALHAELNALAGSKDLPSLLILRAEGRTFCAGADTKERPASAEWPWEDRWREHHSWWRTLRLLREMPLISIAVVNGPAIGGGALLALSCDLRIASCDAFLKWPEALFGVSLPWGGADLISSIAGADWAKEVVLTGRKVTAEEAARRGLFHRISDSSELADLEAELVEQLSRVQPRIARNVKASFSNSFMRAGWTEADSASSFVG